MRKDRYEETTNKIKGVDAEVTVVVEEVKPQTITPRFVERKVSVTIPKLNVRYQPSVDSESFDTISRGQTVTISAEKDGWGKLKFIDGWINLKYTRNA